VTTTVTVAVAPLANGVGRLQVIGGGAAEQAVPALGVIDTTAMLAGHVSVRTTLLAADGPLLETVVV
jgi:hypothetical protein